LVGLTVNFFVMFWRLIFGMGPVLVVMVFPFSRRFGFVLGAGGWLVCPPSEQR